MLRASGRSWSAGDKELSRETQLEAEKKCALYQQLISLSPHTLSLVLLLFSFPISLVDAFGCFAAFYLKYVLKEA